VIGGDAIRTAIRALIAPIEAQAPAEARAVQDAANLLVAAPDQAAWQLAAPQLQSALDALAARLGVTRDDLAKNALRSQLPAIPGLDGLVRPDGLHADVGLGPLALRVDAPRLVASFDGAGPVDLGLQPPSSVGVSLGFKPFGGAGTLEYRREPRPRFAGALGLRLGVVDVRAFGVVEDEGTALAVALLLVARFSPGIQLSFGFALSAVGGLVCVNRGVDVDEVKRRLADGSAGDALFAGDPERNAPDVLRALETMFSPKGGAAVVGPAAQITWLEISGTGVSFMEGDLAVLVEFPGPARIVLVGRLVVQVPPKELPLLHLQIDALGVLDFARSTLSIDASLVRSHALGVFTVTGDVAARLSWGERPYALLSAGGFYPGFKPEPALDRPLRRLGLSLDSPLPGIYVRAEGYFAATPNTLQLGGRLEAGIHAGPVRAGGFVALDALLQRSPFRFAVDYSAGFFVSFSGTDLGSISISGRITGPGPITITASFEFEVLFFDISWSDTFTLGSPAAVPTPSVTAASELERELKNPRNLHAPEFTDPAVTLAPASPPADRALVGPTGRLVWTQTTLPLATPLRRVRDVPLASPDEANVALADPSVAAEDVPAEEWFSPASFLDLSGADALNRPSFERLQAGRNVRLATERGPAHPLTVGVKEFVKPADSSLDALLHLFPPGLLLAVAARAAEPTARTTDPRIRLVPETWLVRGDGGEDGMRSETEAHEVAVTLRALRPAAAVSASDGASLAGLA
jgi:hypothetical protein